jgi:curved DNA-binding protein CbpA
MNDFYYILGLDANCTSNEIKEAYRKLSKKFHPDLNQGDKYFESRFREVKDAYKTLSDPVKRNGYDAVLRNSKTNPPGNDQKKQHYYREQAENLRRKEEELRRREAFSRQNARQSQTRPPSFSKSKNGPGIGMSIVLILIVLILGVYLVESFSNSKKHTVNKVATVNTFVVKTRRHHRKKHNWITKINEDSEKPKSDSITKLTKTAQPVVVKAKQPLVYNPKPLVASNAKQPVLVSNKQTTPTVNTSRTNYLYTTYVIPNATGIINLRKFSDYSSPVIGTIPANSQVSVIEKGNVYYKVSFNNEIGYVPKWVLQTK